MKILRCDMCGREFQIRRIKGTEFATGGYETLSVLRTNVVQDVCGRCYKDVMKLWQIIRAEVNACEKNLEQLARERIDAMVLVPAIKPGVIERLVKWLRRYF